MVTYLLKCDICGEAEEIRHTKLISPDVFPVGALPYGWTLRKAKSQFDSKILLCDSCTKDNFLPAQSV
jgi:hypothetical protein